MARPALLGQGPGPLPQGPGHASPHPADDRQHRMAEPTAQPRADHSARSLRPEELSRPGNYLAASAPVSVLRRLREHAMTQPTGQNSDMLPALPPGPPADSAVMGPIAFDRRGPVVNRPSEPPAAPGTGGTAVHSAAPDLGMAQRRAAAIGTTAYMVRRQQYQSAMAAAAAFRPGHDHEHGGDGGRGDPTAETGAPRVAAPGQVGPLRWDARSGVVEDQRGQPRARDGQVHHAAHQGQGQWTGAMQGDGTAAAVSDAATRRSGAGLPKQAVAAAMAARPQRQGPQLPPMPEMPLPIRTREPMQVVAPRRNQDLPVPDDALRSDRPRLRERQSNVQWAGAALDSEAMPAKRRRLDGPRDITTKRPERRRGSVRPDRSRQGGKGWRGRGDPGGVAGMLADEEYY